MSSYYYFASSLQMLRKEIENPLTPQEFIELCRAQLSEKDFALIHTADNFGMNEKSGDDEQPSTHEVLEKWTAFNMCLRYELAALRAEKIGDQTQRDLYANQMRQVADVISIAKKAESASDPLEADDIIFSERWDYLEQLEINHFFDLHMILIYYLKLQLLARKKVKTRNRGMKTFKQVFSNIQATGS